MTDSKQARELRKAVDAILAAGSKVLQESDLEGIPETTITGIDLGQAMTIIDAAEDIALPILESRGEKVWWCVTHRTAGQHTDRRRKSPLSICASAAYEWCRDQEEPPPCQMVERLLL